MSCVESWSTDSGVRNPSTAITFVAPGGAGGVRSVDAVSATGGLLSIGLQAAVAASATHQIVTLITMPSPPPAPSSASPQPCGRPPEEPPGRHEISAGTYPA